MAVFEAMRMSLSYPTVDDADLLGRIEPSISRTEYLKSILSEERHFIYRGFKYVYLPLNDTKLAQNIYIGYLGKKTIALESAGPEEFFVKSRKEKWSTSLVYFDVAPKEQIIFAQKRGVGTSRLILETLFNSNQKNFSSSWHTDIEYISKSSSFHRAASEYKGRITELRFVFNPANGLSGFDKFKELDKLIQLETNSEKSEYSLKNQDGNIKVEGRMINEAALYASEGAGKITMKDGRKVIYNSTQSKVELNISDGLIPAQPEPSALAVIFHKLKLMFLDRKND